MPTGTVKWFNNAKGFGFILPEGGGEDLFVHYSSIRMDGYKTLKAGQPVRFETHATDKGHHAIDVESTDGDGAEAGARSATSSADGADDAKEKSPEDEAAIRADHALG